MNSALSPNAVVIDTGSCATKVGFGGDDEPQSVVPTTTGILNGANTNRNKTKFDKYLTDSSLFTVAEDKIKNIDIQSPYKTCHVLDMESLAAIWMKSLQQNLKMTETQIHSTPVLLSEPSNWSNASHFSSLFTKFREKYCCTLFEEFGSPAMYLCKDAMLSCFAHGKKSSLVLDLGGGSTRCTPIYDGFVINKGCKFTKFGGDYLDDLLSQKLNINESLQKYHLNHNYQSFMRKHIISDLRETVLRLRNPRFDVPNLTFPYKYNDSYRANHAGNGFEPTALKAVEDRSIKLENESVDPIENASAHIEKQTSPTIKLEHDAQLTLKMDNELKYEEMSDTNQNKMSNTKQSLMYTLPDGQRLECSDWKYSVLELMFTDYDKRFASDIEDEWIEKMVHTRSESNIENQNKMEYTNTEQIWRSTDYKTFKFKGLASMVIDSLSGCDIDIRPLCVRNIIVSGGHSRYKGFIERLGQELSCTIPYSYKYKLHYCDTPRERLFTPWLGGSILASTSALQSMWITQEEYKEYGSAIVHRKCF